MKFIFFGTPEFAAIILKKLIKAEFIPVAVVCNPDRPVGRKKIVTPPLTKQVIREKRLEKSVKILQPEKLEIRNWKLEIDKLGGIDFAIVAAYSKIIPKTILDSLPAKFIGVHPSLLPKHRGPTPIQTVILNGDKETGVTLFLVDEKLDHGQIIAQQKLAQPKPFSNSRELENELAGLSAELLIETLLRFIEGKIKLVPQNEAEATYTKKFKTEDAFIKSEDLEVAQKAGGEIAQIIDRKIRALNPEPGVWTLLNQQEINSLIRTNSRIVTTVEEVKKIRVKILSADIIDGKLKLKKIQIEGKKPVILP
jgi:methionyl-tRNA formyltransferase